MLKDWEMMGKTAGDEGADWAERFERNFYLYIAKLKEWIDLLEPRPKRIEEAEEIPEIKEMMNELPGPLHLNFINELEEIIEHIESKRFD
ncbi:hypothetical protein IMZ08_19135 [Bacillus luteolus]|uniref:Uncharacterized protein n=2 Tax=Litchfieldia luteola TaxID=682179 RepID=A0ABR9QP14_9BACI|nr:hypothetical protein [Cytobacillus luteolus]